MDEAMVEEAWRRAGALAALGSADRVARWMAGEVVCPAAPRGWEEELRRRGLVPVVPADGAGPVLLVAGSGLGPGVAVVGARASDAYGLAVASRVARDVVALGMAVVSGGAEGCDSAAHEAALEVGGRTVVGLGSGHDRPYPAGNRALFERVVARGGALVSAYWPTVAPAKHRFVARNGVIAGLSQAVVCVRARARSGALGTARAAFALGRPVLAVPGDVGEGLSAGPHGLLERGARVLCSLEGLARALGRGARGGAWPVQHRGSGAPWIAAVGRDLDEAIGPLDEVCEAVVRVLRVDSGLDLDGMVVRTDVPVDVVAGALLELELLGLVERLPGDRYALAEGGTVSTVERA